MFERVFEDPSIPQPTLPQAQEGLEEEEVEPEVIIPTFSAEELEAARKEGFQAGKEEGLNASLDSIERQVSATLGNMESSIARLVEEQNNANEELRHLALSVSVSIARKMLPELASRHALDEIERVINSVLPRLIDEPLITIRVHDDVEAAVNSRIEQLSAESGFTGRIIVKPDNGLKTGDCKLEWSCGGAERNTIALWHEIDAIIARNLNKDLVAPPEEPEDVPQNPDEETLPLPLSEDAQPLENGDIEVPRPEGDSASSERQEDEVTTESPVSADIADVSTDPDLPSTTDI